MPEIALRQHAARLRGILLGHHDPARNNPQRAVYRASESISHEIVERFLPKDVRGLIHVAQASGLRYLDLPPEVDLSDPARAALYATASIRIPRHATGNTQHASRDSVTIRGAPILYALAIPKDASNPTAARAFVEWLLGEQGRAILTRNGFTVLEKPIVHGNAPGWVQSLSR